MVKIHHMVHRMANMPRMVIIMVAIPKIDTIPRKVTIPKMV